MLAEPVMTREQVRAVDRWAIQELGLPGVVLMENAGRNSADAAGLLLADVDKPRVAVLAGVGNNGGDGFVLARHLFVRGLAVEVHLLAEREKIAGDARVNLLAVETLGIRLIDSRGRAAGELTKEWGQYDLLVDALGGTGITGELRGDLAVAVEAANATGLPILAIDVPTGLDCDTGKPLGPAIRATMTITLVARKVGFDAPGAADYTGEVVVADIGVPDDMVPR